MDTKKLEFAVIGLSIVTAFIMIAIFIGFHGKLSSIDTWVNFGGAVIGGVLSGLLTMIGVVWTLRQALSSEKKRVENIQEENKRKRINQTRLLIGELEHNVRVLNDVIKDTDTKHLSRLQGGIWKQLNITLDWMPTDTFKEIFDAYMNTWSIQKWGQDQSHKSLKQSEIVRCTECINTLTTIIGELN